MLSQEQVIERFCRLTEEVVREVLGFKQPNDCFCGHGGFWGSEGYGGTYEKGYRNSGQALEFIEAAVREKIRQIKEREVAKGNNGGCHAESSTHCDGE